MPLSVAGAVLPCQRGAAAVEDRALWRNGGSALRARDSEAAGPSVEGPAAEHLRAGCRTLPERDLAQASGTTSPDALERAASKRAWTSAQFTMFQIALT